jgi:hypothetical protein
MPDPEVVGGAAEENAANENAVIENTADDTIETDNGTAGE